MIVDNRFELLADLDQIRRRMDSAFDGFFTARGLDGQHGLVHHSRALYPELRVRETDHGWEIVGDVAGFGAADVEVTLEGYNLRVQGKADEATPEGWRRVLTERRRWNFDKTIRFAEPVDAEGVTAEVKNGVLRVTVPKAKAAAPVRIEVKG